MRRRAGGGLLVAASVALLVACAGATPTESATVEPVLPTYPMTLEYPEVAVEEDVAYTEVDGESLMLDVCLPPGAGDDTDATAERPALVQLHGGSWTRGSKSDASRRSLCQYLAQAGYVVFNVNYRLAPKHTFPAQFDDARAAVEFVRSADTLERYNVDPARVGAVGDSAGGNLAALLGTSGEGSYREGTRVAAVVDLSAPTDLTAEGQELGPYGLPSFAKLQLNYLGCADFEGCDAARAASPGYHADASDPPFLVVHAEDDWVPIEQSERLVEQLGEAGASATFVRVEGQAHASALLDRKICERIVRFLDLHLSVG
ncbi:alpha/beta hydrolase [Herbiconiux sp. SYSU D00978]|uniref:alpha/beta hydrolase n=1 Tax=Herbiconiux sp. SYSU D00978 TaxID=2812562 RepID=UPI001A963B0D|nr:alpha/beta hydrolase [Herbiconiux sp. SYSU D00978]